MSKTQFVINKKVFIHENKIYVDIEQMQGLFDIPPCLLAGFVHRAIFSPSAICNGKSFRYLTEEEKIKFKHLLGKRVDQVISNMKHVGVKEIAGKLEELGLTLA
jgi:hypothetical protein